MKSFAEATRGAPTREGEESFPPLLPSTNSPPTNAPSTPDPKDFDERTHPTPPRNVDVDVDLTITPSPAHVKPSVHKSYASALTSPSVKSDSVPSQTKRKGKHCHV